MKPKNKSFFDQVMLRGLMLLFCLAGFAPALFSQVFTEALRINPRQYEFYYRNALKISSRDFLQKVTVNDTLPIPFFDDFSRPDLSWAPSRFWFEYAIRNIHFLSSSSARAYGDQGISLRTRNRGSVWERNAAPPGPDFRSVSFPSPSFAWSCGTKGWLAFSSDSGKTWTPVSNPSRSLQLDKISFISNETGILIDSAGRVFRTQDGGQNWTQPIFSAGPAIQVRAVVFLNSNRVLLAGDSARTAISDDGGLTFSVSNQPFGRNRHFRNLRFVDGFFGLAVGDSGLVFKTISSGSSWFPLPLNSNETILDAGINPANKKLCWLTGTQGSLFHSQNAGSSWARIHSGTTEDLLCITLVNEFRGWIGTNGGRLHQVVYDPLRPYSRLWQPGSGVFVNSSFADNPPGYGVATLDGLNSSGQPYSLVKNKTGPCDTLTSAFFDLTDFSGTPLFLSFYYQPGTGFIQLIPDPEDSLALQFLGKGGKWQSIWNVKGKGDSTLNSPFRYVSVPVPDSLKFPGSRFRFLNFGNQNGNYDIWNIDYIRLDPEHDAIDSLAADYAVARPPGRLLKSYSALPLEQFRFAVENNLPIFQERIGTVAVNLNAGAANLSGGFYVNRIVPDSVQNIVSLPSSSISGFGSPFESGITFRSVSLPVSLFQSLLRTRNYATFEYGFGMKPDPLTNLYTGNDSLCSRLNLSTVMAYDDGSAELVRGVGQNGSIGVQKFYLPVADTLTDIQLFFARTPENLQQTMSFALVVYDSLDVAGNFASDPPLIRRNFVLPPADSINKFISFSIRDEETLQKRILQGGRSFYIGWQQGLIDDGNEVRIGCDVNTQTPSVFFYKTGGEWKAWNTDSLTLMIRPVFGPEFITSVKEKLARPANPFFPNPARDGFRNARDFSRLTIRDLSGKVLAEIQDGRAGEIIRVALPPGLYFFHWLEDGRRPVVQKMLME